MPIITRYWWVLALRGVIALILGVLALAAPAVTFELLAIFIAVYLVLDGIIAIVAGVRAAENHRRWLPFALEGVADLLAGVIIYLYPEVLIALIAVWAIITGLMLLIPAFRLPAGSGRWWLIVNGVLSLLLGIAIVVQPIAGVVFVVWSVAIYAILFGIVFILLAFQVRRQHLA